MLTPISFRHSTKLCWLLLTQYTENREARVGNWRDFNTHTSAKKAKKAKKNLHVLG